MGLPMGRVADAWQDYLRVAEELDLAIGGLFQRSESAEDVRAAFAAAGLEVDDDLVEFYTVLGQIEPHQSLSIFENYQMLDLAHSIAHHDELRQFAADHAEGGDPDEVYAPFWHPIAAGKPTILVDRGSGAVVERWWDELDVRPVENDLASWIRSRATDLETAEDLDRFRRRVDGEAHIYFEAFYFDWTDYWMDRKQVKTGLEECSSVVVKGAGAGQAPNGCGLEEVQARLVADLLVTNGYPADQISFVWEPIGDGRISHAIFVEGYR